MSANPRHRPRPDEKHDPNLGQKEAEREKAELEEEDEGNDDQLKQMTERTQQERQRPSTD